MSTYMKIVSYEIPWIMDNNQQVNSQWRKFVFTGILDSRLQFRRFRICWFLLISQFSLIFHLFTSNMNAFNFILSKNLNNIVQTYKIGIFISLLWRRWLLCTSFYSILFATLFCTWVELCIGFLVQFFQMKIFRPVEWIFCDFCAQSVLIKCIVRLNFIFF